MKTSNSRLPIATWVQPNGKEKTEHALERVGMFSSQKNISRRNSAGGQQQRVARCPRSRRATPLILMADEPTGKSRFAKTAKRSCSFSPTFIRNGATICLVTQRPAATRVFADHTIHLFRRQKSLAKPMGALASGLIRVRRL